MPLTRLARVSNRIPNTNKTIVPWKNDRIFGGLGDLLANRANAIDPYGILRYRCFDRGFGLFDRSSDRPPDRLSVMPNAAL